MENKTALMMDAKDDVAIVLNKTAEGEEVILPNGEKIVALNEIPMSHKIAIKDIEVGAPIIRYGEQIGYATKAIKKGEWVHVHNLDAEKIMQDKEG